jgi:hypothetical protein
MKRPAIKISDRELDSLLQGLREDVAAPADFRARVMQRLQAEGLVAAPARPGWRERLSTWFTPARLGLSLSGAAALAVAYLFFHPVPQTAPAAAPGPRGPVEAAPATSAQAFVAPREKAVAKLPKRPTQAAPVAAPVAAPLPEQQEELAAQSSVPVAQGRAVAPTPASTVSISSVDPKPTVVVLTPEVPLGKPRTADSEVRNNVIHAARHESAFILFNLQEAGPVRVVVYDRLGRTVAVLYDGDLSAGPQDLRWSGAADAGGMAASGIYQVRISAPGLQARHNILLAK